MAGTCGTLVVANRHPRLLTTVAIPDEICSRTIVSPAHRDRSYTRKGTKYLSHGEKRKNDENASHQPRKEVEHAGYITLYSPEYLGQQLPVGQRARDRVAAAQVAHYCMFTTRLKQPRPV